MRTAWIGQANTMQINSDSVIDGYIRVNGNEDMFGCASFFAFIGLCGNGEEYSLPLTY